MTARTLRLAHRGDWRRGQENSVEAFAAALKVPACDGIELDIRLSRDGIPVCSHDRGLRRLQGLDRRVDDLTAAELARLGVPTLAEVLALIPGHAFLDAELKDDPGDAPLEVLAAARGRDFAHGAVSSFRAATLQRVSRFAPSWPRWFNADDAEPATIATAVELGCRALAVEWRALDRRSVARIQAAGLDVVAFTVRRRPTYRRLERLGVVAICAEANALDG